MISFLSQFVCMCGAHNCQSKQIAAASHFLCSGARLAPPRVRERDASLLHTSLSAESVGSALIDQKAIVILYVYFGEWNNGPLGAHALPYEVLLSL